MICDDCLKVIKENFIGAESKDKVVCLDISIYKSGQLFLPKDGQPYPRPFALYAKGEKTLRNGKKKIQEDIPYYFNAKYCAKCGVGLEKRLKND